MHDDIKNNIRAAFVSAIGECDVNDETAARGIDAACSEAMSVIERMAADLHLCQLKLSFTQERLGKLHTSFDEMKKQRDDAMARSRQDNSDRERTFRENCILTRMWCELRNKVKALPKSEMTIGGWHDLMDFVRDQSRRQDLRPNLELTRPANDPASETGAAGLGSSGVVGCEP